MSEKHECVNILIFFHTDFIMQPPVYDAQYFSKKPQIIVHQSIVFLSSCLKATSLTLQC